jgi:hypothetical protein
MATWHLTVTHISLSTLTLSANGVTLVNSSRDPIRVRDEGPKSVKIKGLRLNVPAKAKSRTSSMDMRRSPSVKPKEKLTQIKGAKIEFTSEEDKRLFIEKVREVQGTFFAG